MPTFYQMMDNVLVRLGDPRAQTPGDAQLLQQVSSQTRTVLRSKRNSGNPWSYAETQVVTQPDEGLYQIQANNFGTPIAVLTFNDYQDTNFVVRRIPFFMSADFATREYSLPQNAGAWGAYYSWNDPNHQAERCCITWRSNVPYIEFLPTGTMDATYTIKFLESADGVVDMALASSPVRAEDADLIEIRAAKSLLPLTMWEGMDDKANQAKRINLAQSLMADESLAFEQFNAANMVTSGPSTRPRWHGSIVG